MSKTHKAIMHFNKQGSKSGKPWTVHYRGVCYLVSAIQCMIPMVSEWKPNKKNNPRAFFTAQVSKMEITPHDIAILK
jgi:hypothetical protein